MREIKFKIIDLVCKADVTDAYRPSSEDEFGMTPVLNETIAEINNDKDVVLLQYTGLKDKNGVEIYEGDICRNGDWVSDAHTYDYREEEVIYNENEASFSGWNYNEDGMTCEVIGNIYENKELLDD
jgi:uncharacterized phage protein (TIGR01671 family)